MSKKHFNRPVAWIIGLILFANLIVAAITLLRARPAAADSAPSAPITIRSLYDVGIFTPDVQKLGAFYDKLGFHRTINSDNIIVYSMPSQDFVILKSSASDAPSAHVAVGFFVDDLDPVKANLQKQGISFEGPKPLEAYLVGIKIHDPMGNEVHFLLPKQ